MFVGFVSLIMAAFNQHDILVKIDMLHKKTGVSTFYELFNVRKDASMTQINHVFRKANKSQVNPYKGKLSDSEYKSLIMTAYSTLKNHREKYDGVLANGKMIFINHKKNFKTNSLTLILFGIITIVLVDFSVFIRNYLKYTAMPKKRRKAMPRMFIYSAYAKIKGL
ncbi:hypothetical protein ECANGB1_1060 [Enterospora canceri]|uniref:J domain-containing protein n=1 Tax=Enterospora canceri TaxID=1081671 RepID=A0A1Y1S6W6_9MICR|nr:hypothetical protein ECANGB1_1060 [Enterospora canceri]